jgi:hypothetical protein
MMYLHSGYQTAETAGDAACIFNSVLCISSESLSKQPSVPVNSKRTTECSNSPRNRVITSVIDETVAMTSIAPTGFSNSSTNNEASRVNSLVTVTSMMVETANPAEASNPGTAVTATNLGTTYTSTVSLSASNHPMIKTTRSTITKTIFSTNPATAVSSSSKTRSNSVAKYEGLDSQLFFVVFVGAALLLY